MGIRYGKGNKPAAQKGEGKFDRVAVRGPTLIECKLVATSDKKK